MKETARILIVDDDIRICRTLSIYLEREGYLVNIATNGEEMWRYFNNNQPDVILLDVMLPGVDGITLARELRTKSDVGIIILSGKDKPIDTIIGLEIGADDYVTKPFDERQLLARIHSLLRRSTASGNKPDTDTNNILKYQFEGWQLDLFAYELISPTGENVNLTSHEYRLLEIFIKNPGCVLSRNQIMQHLYQRDWSLSDRSVDVLIGKLRKKVEDDPSQPKLILTIHNIGYKFTGRVSKISN